MQTFLEKATGFLESDEGPTATEYAVLIAVICIAVISAMSGFGGHVGNIYTSIQGTMPAAGGGS